MAKKTLASGEECYNYILKLIMTKQLLPEDKIPEIKIAEELNISRTPVRDAMRRLANEGLIDIFPNRFAQVKNYSSQEIRDIGTVRMALDTMAVKLAVICGNQLDFLSLSKIAQECLDASNKNDLDLRRKADCDFHMTLTNISQNELLTKFQNELYLRVQFIMLHHPNPVHNETLHLQQHFDLVKALMDREEQQALSIIRSHLSSFYDLESSFPDNFFTVPYLNAGSN